MLYIKKYYKVIIAAAIILVLAVSLLSGTTIKVDGYSVDNAYNTVKELSSDKYKGRALGTAENMEAVSYVENQFKSMGLAPAGDDNTYRRVYADNSKVYNGMPILEVLDKDGKVVKQYQYNQDFIEQSYGYSIPGEVTSSISFLDFTGESFPETEITKTIAVVKPVIPQYTDKMDFLKSLSISLVNADYEGLIQVVPDDTDFVRRSGDIGNRLLQRSGYELPALITKQKAADELKNYCVQGYKVHMKSTFDIKAGSAADLAGMIPGSGNGYLFITAHIDGLGQASDGAIYPGALDDASGVGVLLEIARYIKSQGKTPSQNIVFVVFNGEEAGLLGSHRYVRKLMYPPYEVTGAINLDMVGANKDMPLTIMYNSVHSTWVDMTMDPSAKLRDHLENIAQRMNINVNEVDEPNSDHFWFNSAAIPAVTLIDYDKDSIHIPSDNINNVSKKNMDRAMSLVMNYVSISAYSNISSYGYNMALGDILDFIMDVYPLLIVLAAIIILGYMQYRRRKDVTKRRIGNFPALGMLSVIVFIGLVTYFPLRYQNAPAQSTEALIFLGEGILNMFKSMLTIFLFCAFMAPGLIILVTAKKRTMSAKYEGTGKIVEAAYYISVVLFVMLSFYMTTMYNTTGHLAFTPDFARYAVGKVGLYAVLALITYAISKFMHYEIGGKHRTLAGYLSFVLIFFMLLSCFYTPITTNRFVTDLTYRNANVTDYSAFD